jgi:hypothetical protein
MLSATTALHLHLFSVTTQYLFPTTSLHLFFTTTKHLFPVVALHLFSVTTLYLFLTINLHTFHTPLQYDNMYNTHVPITSIEPYHCEKNDHLNHMHVSIIILVVMPKTLQSIQLVNI